MYQGSDFKDKKILFHSLGYKTRSYLPFSLSYEYPILKIKAKDKPAKTNIMAKKEKTTSILHDFLNELYLKYVQCCMHFSF